MLNSIYRENLYIKCKYNNTTLYSLQRVGKFLSQLHKFYRIQKGTQEVSVIIVGKKYLQCTHIIRSTTD